MRLPLVSKITLFFMSFILLSTTACSKDAVENETVTSNTANTVDVIDDVEQEVIEAANSGFPETDIYLARMLYRCLLYTSPSPRDS